MAFQRTEVGVFKKRPHCRESRVCLGAGGQRLDGLAECRPHLAEPRPVVVFLALGPLGLQLLGVGYSQHVFGVVPQQVRRNARGFLDPQRHQEALAGFLFALARAGIDQIDQAARGVDLDDEGNLPLFQTEGRQPVPGIVGALFALVVIVQSLQNHPRTSSLRASGTATTPFSSRARKKRGVGSAGSVKSRSWSM